MEGEITYSPTSLVGSGKLGKNQVDSSTTNCHSQRLSSMDDVNPTEFDLFVKVLLFAIGGLKSNTFFDVWEKSDQQKLESFITKTLPNIQKLALKCETIQELSISYPYKADLYSIPRTNIAYILAFAFLGGFERFNLSAVTGVTFPSFRFGDMYSLHLFRLAEFMINYFDRVAAEGSYLPNYYSNSNGDRTKRKFDHSEGIPIGHAKHCRKRETISRYDY